MNKINFTFYLFLIFGLIFYFSCKKKSQNSPRTTPPGPTASVGTPNLNSFDSLKISTVEFYGTDHINNVISSMVYFITYNSDNSVNSINMSDSLGNYHPGWQKNFFVYENGNYMINNIDSPGGICQLNILANSFGMVTQSASSSGCYGTATASYNNTEILNFTNSNSGQVSSYFWSNGNLSFSVSTELYPVPPDYVTFDTLYDTVYYTYDNTKKGQVGDIFQISDFLMYGRSLIRTLNLPTGPGISYSFDSLGRVTQCIKVSSGYANDTIMYSYQY